MPSEAARDLAIEKLFTYGGKERAPRTDNEVKSTLIELPPEFEGLEEDSGVEMIEAGSKEELALHSHIQDEQVIERLLLPGQTFGPYRILGFVASGGMGEVYAAERVMKDGRRHGPVALKVISPEYRSDWAIVERFKREAKISRAIRSPHVARVYEFGETVEGHLFLSMELLSGEELFDRLCVRRSFESEEVAEIALGILAGLGAVHQHGFIHRDVKPENVYFARLHDGSEKIKILDFGIAKDASEESDPRLSTIGKLYGTPEYIAPEQGLNPDVDHRADLYSVGVIMWECLVGSLPFQGDSAYTLILAHQNDPFPNLPSSIDPELAAIVEKAMKKNAADRFQTATEFAAVVQDWLYRQQDDELGVNLRDSQDLDRVRIDTPERMLQTPVRGESTPKKEKQTPRPKAFEAGEAPPVQIFSKPKRSPEAGERDKPKVPGAHGAAAEVPTPNRPKRKSQPVPMPTAPEGRSKPSPDARAVAKVGEDSANLGPKIVTALIIVAIIAASVYTWMETTKTEAASDPPATQTQPQ